MLPAYGMVFSLHNPSTGNGHIPGWSFVLSLERAGVQAEGEIARLNRMGEELLRQRREFEAELARQRAQSQADIEELRAQLEAAKYAASRAGERSPQEELASSRRELAGAGLGMTVVSTPCTTCAQWGAHSAAADERIRELGPRLRFTLHLTDNIITGNVQNTCKLVVFILID